MSAVQQWQAIRPDFSASGRSRANATRLLQSSGQQLGNSLTALGNLGNEINERDATNLVNKLVAQGLSPQEAVQTVQTQTATPASTTKPVQAPSLEQEYLRHERDKTKLTTPTAQPATVVPQTENAQTVNTQTNAGFLADAMKLGNTSKPMSPDQKMITLDKQDRALEQYEIQADEKGDKKLAAYYRKARQGVMAERWKVGQGTNIMPATAPNGGVSNQSKDIVVGTPAGNRDPLSNIPNSPGLLQSMMFEPGEKPTIGEPTPKKVNEEAGKELLSVLDSTPKTVKKEVQAQVKAETGITLPVSNATKATNKLQDLLVNGNRYEQAAASKAIITLETMKSKNASSNWLEKLITSQSLKSKIKAKEKMEEEVKKDQTFRTGDVSTDEYAEAKGFYERYKSSPTWALGLGLSDDEEVKLTNSKIIIDKYESQESRRSGRPTAKNPNVYSSK